MTRTVNVRHDGEAPPVFPPGCCLCDARRPDGYLEIRERSRSWSELLLRWKWLDARWVTVTIPVCDRCRRELVARRRWRLVWMSALLVVGVFGAMYWASLQGLSRGERKCVWMAGGLLALGVGFGGNRLRPIPFDLVVREDHVVYRFASRGYAERFLADNPASRRV
jgi:hypothetical protein